MLAPLPYRKKSGVGAASTFPTMRVGQALN